MMRILIHKLNALSVSALLVATFLICNSMLLQAQRLGSHAKVRGSAPAQQDSLFLPAVTYDSGGFAVQSVAVADVNADGHVDMVVALMAYSETDYQDGGVAVLLGNGDGTFQTAVEYRSGGRESLAIAVADVNGDAKPDILVANYCVVGDTCGGLGVVGVLLGNGDGTFQPALTYTSGGYEPHSIAVADVNGDHKPDLLVSSLTWGSGICVLLGNGDGTFQPAVTFDGGGGGVLSLVVVDLNQDGKLDVVATTYSGVDVAAVLLGNGDGTFQPAVTYPTAGYESGSVSVSDVNGDHKPDLVTRLCVAGDYGCSTSLIAVLIGNGDGTFQAAVTSPASGYYVGLSAVADVNGDGKPDVVITNRADTGGASGALGVMQGNGDGTFQPAALYASGSPAPSSPGVADLNGDGKPEALLSNLCTNSSCVGIMLNHAGPFHATKTSLVSFLNPSIFGQSITFSAKVTSSSGKPTGTVVLLDGRTELGSATLGHGSASIELSSLAAGPHSIAAWYPLSAVFGGSTSPVVDQVINPATTTTALVSSVNPVSPHQSVRYTVSIANQYGGTITGEVRLNSFWSLKVVGNQATFQTSYGAKETGAHSITATYMGDGNNASSASSTFVQYVGTFPVASKVVLSASPSPSQVGQPVTFTASVRSAYAKYGAIPDGELVWFYDGTTVLGSVPLAGGKAQYTTSALSAKTHTIKASYPGNAIFKASTVVLKQVVAR